MFILVYLNLQFLEDVQLDII